jgi:hypothetical protein
LEAYIQAPRIVDPTQTAPTGCLGVGCFLVRDPVPGDEETLCANNLCIDRCPDDGDINKCPAAWLGPEFLSVPANGEEDTVSQRGAFEQLTVHYHADRGKMRSDVRVIRDGTGAWNRDYATLYYAPKDPGFARVWVVVRDNRGGVDWISTPLYIR